MIVISYPQHEPDRLPRATAVAAAAVMTGTPSDLPRRRGEAEIAAAEPAAAVSAASSPQALPTPQHDPSDP